MKIILVLVLLLVGVNASATSPTIAFTPVSQPVQLYSGDDWYQYVELAATPTGAAFPLTGYHCRAQVKRTYYDAAVLQDLGCIVIGNRVGFGMTRTQTSTLRGLNGVWDLSIISDSDGTTSTIWLSPFKIALTTR